MAEGVPKYIAVRDNLRQRAQAMYLSLIHI